MSTSSATEAARQRNGRFGPQALTEPTPANAGLGPELADPNTECLTLISDLVFDCVGVDDPDADVVIDVASNRADYGFAVVRTTSGTLVEIESGQDFLWDPEWGTELKARDTSGIQPSGLRFVLDEMVPDPTDRPPGQDLDVMASLRDQVKYAERFSAKLRDLGFEDVKVNRSEHGAVVVTGSRCDSPTSVAIS